MEGMLIQVAAGGVRFTIGLVPGNRQFKPLIHQLQTVLSVKVESTA